MKKFDCLIKVGLTLLILSLVCCNIKEDQVDQDLFIPDGTPVSFTFGGFTDEIDVISLRSTESDGDSQAIDNLRLLVFDEAGRFLYSRKAVLEGEIDAPESADSYLPDLQKVNTPKVHKLSAKLLSSSKKRYIHFIANHDWESFPQDYFLGGLSQGELIPGLVTGKSVFWRLIELDQLKENVLAGKVVKLLRNKAKISVENMSTDGKFRLEKFAVYNLYDRGTVAPFVYHKDLSFTFPGNPDQPTIPADVSLINLPFDTYPNGVDVFEHSNAGDKPMFILIYGQLEGETPGYYKIDLAKFDESTGITSLYSMVRNYWYQVNVLRVFNGGYKTAEEAAKNPASNNLFASLELESYSSVSNGENTLSVDELEAVYTKLPAVFKTKIRYSQGAKNVQAFGLWEQEDYDEYIEEMNYRVDYPDLADNEGELIITFKKIPNDTKKFQVSVVAKPNDGMSASIITRKVTVLLRPPYLFKASLESKVSNGVEDVVLSFDVPSTITASLFPFDVYILTKELTPKQGQGMSYVIGMRTYAVKYQVTESFRGKRVELYFIRNTSASSEDITLTSNFFADQKVRLEKKK